MNFPNKRLHLGKVTDKSKAQVICIEFLSCAATEMCNFTLVFFYRPRYDVYVKPLDVSLHLFTQVSKLKRCLRHLTYNKCRLSLSRHLYTACSLSSDLIFL